jgi:UDP-N-acetylmuramoylalanine--D-glutamate ligase
VEAVESGEPWDVVVAEISSFQLEAVHTFRPRISVWLNLTGDHLDRHDGLDAYAEAKARIFLHQDASDAAVVNRDDPIVWEHACRGHATLLPYSVERRLGVGGWREGDEAVILLPGTDGVRLPVSELRLPGLHNLGNALAATLAAAALGVEVRSAWRSACGFDGLAHRIQHFLTWRGIRFVDDSKATNVDAAKVAMETVAGPLVLLAGGVDKLSDYGPLKPALARWARRVVVVGSAAERMIRELEGTAPVAKAADWAEGVRIAVAEAKPGDTVLLAPAAASFDFFSGYAERGDVFQRLCREETQRIERGEG